MKATSGLKSSRHYTEAWVSSSAFWKAKDESSDEANNAAEQNIQSQLKAQYHRDIDQDVSSLESILDDTEDQPEESVVLPAPDYDEPNVTVDDVLVESEMESFSEKNTVEHASVEDMEIISNQQRSWGCFIRGFVRIIQV